VRRDRSDTNDTKSMTGNIVTTPKGRLTCAVAKEDTNAKGGLLGRPVKLTYYG